MSTNPITSSQVFFVDVILPIPLNQTSTYAINKDEAAFLKPGMRVAVPFGKTKIYTAIVYEVHGQTPTGYETKSIDHILDQVPIVTPIQLQHWKWMASYYMCSLGVVVRAALPGAFLLESETIIKLAAGKEIDGDLLSDEEYLVYEALKQQSSIHINGIRAI